MPSHRRWLLPALAAAVLGVAAVALWQRLLAEPEHAGLASGNGRIEAVDIDVATRTPGRLKEVLVREGEFVTAGQVLATMDTGAAEAQRRQAEAQLEQARSAIVTARSQVAQRQSDKAAAQAVVAQRKADLGAARAHLAKSEDLARQGFISPQALDDERARVASAQAALAAAQAQVAAVDAAIASARAQVSGAESSASATEANLERIQSDIDDMVLRSPRDGRVQVIVARPGEVLAAGGRVLSLLDLTDVSMNFFLPTAVAGRLAIGSEARIVLDVAPQYVIPAEISFVSDVAQFTPKTVETASEREKLMFRVRARIPPSLLRQHLLRVKTGLPGVAYVRTDPTAPWPEHLQVKLPQ